MRGQYGDRGEVPEGGREDRGEVGRGGEGRQGRGGGGAGRAALDMGEKKVHGHLNVREEEGKKWGGGSGNRGGAGRCNDPQ